eukprot:8287985-Pyramimonas_sp.AAC.1
MAWLMERLSGRLVVGPWLPDAVGASRGPLGLCQRARRGLPDGRRSRGGTRSGTWRGTWSGTWSGKWSGTWGGSRSDCPGRVANSPQLPDTVPVSPSRRRDRDGYGR